MSENSEKLVKSASKGDSKAFRKILVSELKRKVLERISNSKEG